MRLANPAESLPLKVCHWAKAGNRSERVDERAQPYPEIALESTSVAAVSMCSIIYASHTGNAAFRRLSQSSARRLPHFAVHRIGEQWEQRPP